MKENILSGMRTTGKLHIGNYFGALSNWLKLQDEYKCYFLLADYHALTTDYKDTSKLKENIIEMAKDWLSAGISPEKSVIFLQSLVPEHCELHLIFSMFVPVPWLERNPTLKEMIRDYGLREKVNYGLLGYPVLQAVDILMYKPNKVPVGEDQLAHLELTRQIARWFNSLYKKIFPEPQPLLSRSPKVPGIDGKKMSKSLKNYILVRDEPEVIKEKVMQAFTDPQKIRKNDPGHPEGCVVFAYHNLVNAENLSIIEKECREGKRGCVACKEEASQKLSEFFREIRERAKSLKDEDVKDIIFEGSKRARSVASEVLKEVKEAIGMW